LLRLIRQRWSVESEWHWVRDTQLGEDAHRYANRSVHRRFPSCEPWWLTWCGLVATAQFDKVCVRWLTTSKECSRWALFRSWKAAP